jgi:hypothetical protein
VFLKPLLGLIFSSQKCRHIFVNWYIKSQEVRGGASHRPSLLGSNSHYETDFGVSSTFGAGNTKIGFLKACRRQAFKKPIFIMRIADFLVFMS